MVELPIVKLLVCKKRKIKNCTINETLKWVYSLKTIEKYPPYLAHPTPHAHRTRVAFIQRA